MRILLPERPGGQGLDSHQEESGNRAIRALLLDDEVAGHVDLVITWREPAYEVWSRRGMIRFQRLVNGARPEYRVIEQIGENPIERQGNEPIATIADELAAAARSGYPTEDPNAAFIEPSEVSYPYAYERVAQLFDSPLAPDIVVSPRCYTFGRQRGQHGALDVVQSRAPLAFAGPGIRPGRHRLAPRHVDVAPTIAHLMRFPLIDGRDASGCTASERGVAPDVYLKRQDGRVLEEILEADAPGPERVYMVLFDGLSNSEMRELLDRDDPAVRNLRRILDRGAFFELGVTASFPSITWPSHATILTGAWCGHHDIVNPAYYRRDTREALAPQAMGMMTETFLGDGVETLYEAFRRVGGAAAFTAAIHEPQGRGADHAPLEGRVVGPRDRLKALTPELVAEVSERYLQDGHEDLHREAVLDARGVAQVMVLFDDPAHEKPVFVAHEFTLTDGAGHEYGPHGDGLREAIAETDRRLGRVLDMLEEKGLANTTLFVFTADHGMAAQDFGLHANPARHPERVGMRAMTTEPMIWLRDMRIEIEAAPDGRTARIRVLDNDADSSGEHRPVEGAEILLCTQSDRERSRTRTNAAGLAGIVTPSDLEPTQIVLAVRHDDFNPRHLRLDGTNLAPDLRRDLFAE